MRRLLVIVLTLAATILGAPAIATAQPGGYVALGDSYSSGLGTGSYTLSSGCKRGTLAYPYLYSGTASGFVACSGYNIDEVRRDQLSAVTTSTQLVTMTVGGNDIGFSTVVSQCTAFSSNSACTSAVNAAVARIPAMRANLVTLLREIRATASNATIVLLGYPHLYATGSTCGFGQPNQTKRVAMFNGGELLNEALKRAVADTGDSRTRWVDVRPAFSGHDICATSSQRWINGLVLVNSAESYHPNRAGHSSGYLPALRTAVTAVAA